LTPETVAIGVDLGGTETLVGVVDGKGRVIVEQRFETPTESVEAVAKIATACRAVAAEAGIAIERVGIGAPGPLELSKGIIELAPNLGWERVPLKAMFAEELGCAVWLDNDANAAALGEAWVGAGRHGDRRRAGGRRPTVSRRDGWRARDRSPGDRAGRPGVYLWSAGVRRSVLQRPRAGRASGGSRPR
jgi:hypothetical protein